MGNFVLRKREGTETFHRIIHKRKWVGRVVQHADGDWLGIIGKTTVRRPTRQQAFDDVVAMHLGFASVAALHNHNRRVTEARRLLDRVGDHAMQEVSRGNFEPFEQLLRTPAGATAVIKAFSRTVFRK